MKIRLTTIDDAKDIFYVDKITWLNVYPNKQYNITYEDIAKRFANDKKFIAKIKKGIEGYNEDNNGWVAEISDKIVGYSVILKEYGKYTIGGIYVLPKHQGKGIGKALLQKIIEFTKDSKELWLEVAAYNKNAINFYKKSGFHIVSKSERQHKIINDKFMPTIQMKKEF